ncbi:hypothetical protein HOLleu_05232 [Holothuria leucospilota]|uniref:Uncharacterized protein n=1 Tax=Holothuria leucospilota TaxID=206669 RepID=A0A9Q1CKC8_HOLLE|nr:hypothetical protein HOLleu_05232 [Holothuria leucospilota]
MKVSTESTLTFLTRSIFLISTIFTIGIFSQGPDCTKEVFITGDTMYTSTSDSTTLTASIDLTGQISLGETICFFVKPKLNENVFKNYKVEIEGDYNESYPLVYALNLTQVTRTYALRDQYTFAEPSLSVYCVCDCPGGSDHYTEVTDHCTNSSGPICQNVVMDTAANGCPLTSVAVSKSCCSVTVSPSTDPNRYIAYRLGNFKTVFDFTLSSFYTSNGEPLKPPRKITAALKGKLVTNDGDESQSSMKNTMDILDIPTTNLYSNEIGGEIMSNADINTINEWNFHKLGWFKIKNSTFSTGDPAMLKDVLSVSVTNCLEDEYTVTPDVSYDQNDVKPWGSPLYTTAGGNVISAVYDPLGSSARVNYRVSPQMSCGVHLSTPAKSFSQSGESHLKDFSIERAAGDSTVIMKFSGTSGVISGNVQAGSESDGYNILDKVNFIVPFSLHDEVTVRLTLLLATEPITRVCLHHISNPTHIICKNVVITVTRMKIPLQSPKLRPKLYPTEETATTRMHVHSSPKNGNYKTAERHFEMLLSNGEEGIGKEHLRWYQYMFPGHWLNGMDNMIEGLVMTAVLILMVVTAAFLYFLLNHAV